MFLRGWKLSKKLAWKKAAPSNRERGKWPLQERAMNHEATARETLLAPQAG